MTARRALPVAVWLCGLAAAVFVILRTPFATDMSAFLPRSDNPSQQVLVDQLSNGVVSHLILVGLEGAPPETLAALSKTLAAKLRPRADLVLVSNGEEAGLARDRDYFWHNRYLLSPGVTPERFTVEGLRAALQRDLQLLGSQMGLLVKRTLPADPTGEMLGLLDRLSGGAHPAIHDGVWFAKDFSRALLMVQTRAAGFDIDAQDATLTAIRAAFDDARRSLPGAQNARLVASGPAVFAVAARAQMKGDATRFSLIATGLVALLLIAAYRTPRLVILALLPVVSGALAGIAAVSLGFGFVHGITLGFGVTLIGEAVDYGIYLFTQTGPQSPPAATLKRIWPTLRLGLLTSVFGFSAMLLSGFPGFVQLGLFTITGLAAALGVTRFVLPALMPAGFQGARASRLGDALAEGMRFAPKVRLVLAALVVGAVVVLALHRGALWQDELSSLNPVPRADQRLDQSLRDDLGAPDVRYMVVLTGTSEDDALAQSARVGRVLSALIGEGVLAGFDAPDRFLPPAATQAMRREVLPDPDTLRATLAQALAGLPFKPDLFEPFIRDVAAAKTQAPLTRASLEGTAIALKLESMLIRRGEEWIAILPLRGVSDPDRLKGNLLVMSSARPDLLDLKNETDSLFSHYLHEAMTLALSGGLAIVVLLAASLRSARRVGAVVAPLAAAVILTAAALVLAQEKLSLFNLFGLLLVVAVGSNYCLFFERADLHRVGADRTRVLTSVVLANLCTVFGFGVLSLSHIPVLHGIGTTVALGTFLSLVCAAILTVRKDAP